MGEQLLPTARHALFSVLSSAEVGGLVASVPQLAEAWRGISAVVGITSKAQFVKLMSGTIVSLAGAAFPEAQAIVALLQLTGLDQVLGIDKISVLDILQKAVGL
jgi:hypothetical protein